MLFAAAMKNAIELVVLDFDGTFTRVDEEARPFLSAYRAGLSRVVGGPIDDAWEGAIERVDADPDRFGWEHEGRIVAPAHADPYVLALTVAQLLLRERGMTDTDRAPVLQRLYQDAYAMATTVFREDAIHVLRALVETGLPLYVVTNSRTEEVERKIATLDAALSERLSVRGDAKKYVLSEPDEGDPRFDALPHELYVRGLTRPIHVRRGRYFDVLRRIWEATGTRPESTIVCGDIYELDLAVPALLGAQVHLVARPSTPAFERDAVHDAGGTFSTELSGLLSRVRV